MSEIELVREINLLFDAINMECRKLGSTASDVDYRDAFNRIVGMSQALHGRLIEIKSRQGKLAEKSPRRSAIDPAL